MRHTKAAAGHSGPGAGVLAGGRALRTAGGHKKTLKCHICRPRPPFATADRDWWCSSSLWENAFVGKRWRCVRGKEAFIIREVRKGGRKDV